MNHRFTCLCTCHIWLAHLIAAGAAKNYYSFLNITIPPIIPAMAEILSLTLNVTISRLNPIGPVNVLVIIEIDGINFTSRVPSADPSIPPMSIKAIKYPMCSRENVICTCPTKDYTTSP